MGKCCRCHNDFTRSILVAGLCPRCHIYVAAANEEDDWLIAEVRHRIKRMPDSVTGWHKSLALSAVLIVLERRRRGRIE